MNTTKLASFLTAAALALSLTSTAFADSMVFKPIKSAKAAAKLPVGTQIAVSCGNCSGISVTTVDSSRSYRQSVTCPLCKKTFSATASSGGGRAGFAYRDAAGHEAYLNAR